MRRWRGNRVAVLPHGFDVKRKGFTKEPNRFGFCLTRRDTAVQIGNVCRPAVDDLLEHYRVFSHRLILACRRIDRTARAARFLLGWPAMVPFPDFA